VIGPKTEGFQIADESKTRAQGIRARNVGLWHIHRDDDLGDLSARREIG
jgi:hypothetical protein